jgi:hypothetical protein
VDTAGECVSKLPGIESAATDAESRATLAILEGKEFVVKKAKPLQTDEAPCESQVVTREDIKGSGELGPCLDFMTDGKNTWMEVPFALVDDSGAFPVTPYTRNGCAKLAWRPSGSFELSLSSFLIAGGFGMGTGGAAGGDGISISGGMDWNELSAVGPTDMKLSYKRNFGQCRAYALGREAARD